LESQPVIVHPTSDSTFGCRFVLAFVGLAMILGCRPPGDPPAVPARAGKPAVYVVNYPLQYFAERIGGDAVEVVFPAPPGEDPAYWQPSEDVVARYQAADLILLNGASYGAWLEQVSLPLATQCNTSEAFQDQYLVLEAQVVHRHGPEGEHAHTGFAFTTWLDPRLAIRQAEAIQQALARLIPQKADQLAERYRQLKSDLEALNARLSQATEGYAGQPLLASHPVYQYLARRCGWNLESVHWEPGELRSEAQWKELESLLQSHPARWMVWEAAPLEETARRLQELGIQCVVFEPCGHAPAQGDYLQAMQQNVARLEPVFRALAAAAK
jgi:zinc transport system substrate-binding protein